MGAHFSNKVHENVAVPLADGAVHLPIDIAYGEFASIQICWHDATSAFGAALYTTNRMGVAIDSLEADEWTLEEEVEFEAVAAAAKGSVMKHLSGINAKRAKVVITPTADSLISVFPHSKD